MKLKTKLILFVLGVIIVPVLFAGILGYYLHLRREWVPSPANIRRVTGELEKAWLSAKGRGGSHGVDYAAVRLPDRLTVWILDEANGIVFTNEEGKEKNGRPGGPDFFDAVPGHYLVTPFEADGARGMKIAFRFPDEPPRSKKPPPFFIRFLERSMWWLLGLIVFSSVMITLIVRSFNRDIGRLINATRRVADGDLEFELAPEGNDEIASLARSFDSMRNNLKESIARRSLFLMGVSHDLKTPLTSIKGYLEAISDGFADDPVKLGRYLSVIGEKSKVLEERIGKLIDYVRMETGDWRMNREDIDLKAFLVEISKMYGEDASVFKRSFRSDLRLPGGVRTTADRTLLLRCFENLFDNAIRYTEEGDAITLSALHKGEEVAVVFRDTGAGIDGPDLNRVFEPFYRGTRSRREEGSGLGLSIVKSIVEAHGWSIGIESAPGRGTALTLRISPVHS